MQGLFQLAKTESIIQYGNRKFGTHARVFSQTLARGNSKNELGQTEDGKKRRLCMKRSKARQETKVPMA